jgi:hypothetical protein
MAVSAKSFRKELNDYNAQLAKNRIRERIPHFWVIDYDHLTYQARNPKVFNDFLRAMSHNIIQIVSIEHEGPLEVAVRLAGPLAVGNQGRINWIKLKEIDPNLEAPQWEGVSAMNILVDNLDTTAKRISTGTNLDSAVTSEHVEVKVNDCGQSLNFVEIPLAEVTEDRIEDGRAIPIYPKGLIEPGVIRTQEQ